MQAPAFYGKPMVIDGRLRKVILIELIFPTVLLIFGIYHGLLQVLYRSGILRARSFLGIEYYQGLTLHGAINAVVFTTFFAVAFGNGVVPYFLERGINVGWAMASMVMMVTGTVLAAVPAFLGKASVLYTFYPPLTAHPTFYIGLVLLVLGSWAGFFNWIPAYRSWVRDNPGRKVPIGVVIQMATFIVWVIATTPVAVEILFQLLPLSLGWTSSVNTVLARMLFWFFGHPLVYFWIMPVYVMLYAMFPALVDGKTYSDFAGRFAAMTLVLYSAPIGLHHQFTEPGIASGWKILHSFFTFFVAVPSLITAFSVAASLEYGARQRGGTGLFRWWSRLPYFDRERWLFGYIFMGLVIFIFGGITGIVNAGYTMNAVVHNTSWLPAHFHMTVAGPVLLAFLGMTLLMCSKLLGHEIAMPRLNVAVPYVFTLGELTFSAGLFMGGLAGEPRRTNLGLTYLNPSHPLYQPQWLTSARVGAVGGTIMTLGLVLFFVVFFATLLRRGRVAEPALQFPVAEAYHDEDVPLVQRFRPWLIAAGAALVIAYTVPIYQAMTGGYRGSPGFDPASPIPLSQAGEPQRKLSEARP